MKPTRRKRFLCENSVNTMKVSEKWRPVETNSGKKTSTLYFLFLQGNCFVITVCACLYRQWYMSEGKSVRRVPIRFVGLVWWQKVSERKQRVCVLVWNSGQKVERVEEKREWKACLLALAFSLLVWMFHSFIDWKREDPEPLLLLRFFQPKHAFSMESWTYSACNSAISQVLLWMYMQMYIYFH